MCKNEAQNMLKICLGFRKFEPQYAYKRYAYKIKHVLKTCNATTVIVGGGDLQILSFLIFKSLKSTNRCL